MLAKAALNGSQCLQFFASYTELCQEQAHINLAKRHNITFEMLTRTGRYTSPTAQLTYEGILMGAYEQIAKHCRRVWQIVSDPGEPTGSFVKIFQRPGEDHELNL